MQNVTQFPKTPSDEALRILTDSLSYYVREAVTDADRRNDLTTGPFIPYYQAA